MEFIDTTALADASVVAYSNLQSIGDTSLFRTKGVYSNIMTTELNMSSLDGTFVPYEVGYKFPFWSSDRSGADCTFTTNPYITVAFTQPHTSSGITLNFMGCVPSEIKVYWYSDSTFTTCIDTKVFNPTNEFECKLMNQVENYYSLKVEFIKTRHPYENVKLEFINYGLKIVWDNETIHHATVHEEVDLTSATIPINTASIEIIDEAEDFSVQNADGLWKSIQSGQKVTITETVDGTDIQMGTFYIKDWEFKDNLVNFDLYDAIGKLEKTKYWGYYYPNKNVTFGIMVGLLMGTAHITEYEVSEDLADEKITGYFPISSCKDALQQLAFSYGAVVDCSRSSKVKIYRPDKTVTSYINLDRKFSGGTSAKLDEQITGVQVLCRKYTLNNTAEEFYNGNIGSGTTVLEFDKPHSSITCTGGTIVSSSYNWVKVTSTGGTITLSGKPYTENEYYISATDESSGNFKNIKKYETMLIFDENGSPNIASDLLDWYSYRQIVNLEYLCNGEKVGDWICIQDSKDTSVYATTRINAQDIDLTGGFIATAECRGYSVKNTLDYYMGNDLVMDGGVLI